MSEFRPVTVPRLTSAATSPEVVAGRARGYADGLAAAAEQAKVAEQDRADQHAAAMQELSQARAEHAAALGAAAAQLSATQVTTLDQLSTQSFQAACQIARIILDAELSDASVAARSAITRALNAPTPSPVHTIRLNPQVAQAVHQGTVPEGVKIQPDPALGAGEAVALYEDGWLLAGLDQALERVSQIQGANP